MNNRNIIIILVIGVLVLGGAYFWATKFTASDTPKSSFGTSPTSNRLISWISDAGKRIDSGDAQNVLSDIDAKMGTSSLKDPSVLFHLNQLKGDALVKLSRCKEAIDAYNAALKNFQDKENKEYATMPEETRNKYITSLQQKTTAANACAK